MTKKIRHAEYIITDHGKGQYVLFYERDILSETGAALVVSDDVFNYALSNPVPLRELMTKYDLFNKDVLYKVEKPKESVYEDPAFGVTKFGGPDYVVVLEEAEYYLHYRTGSHGDRIGIININKEIFDYAKPGNVELKDLFVKFDFSKDDTKDYY